MNQKIINEIAAFTALKPFIRYDAEQGRVFWAVNRKGQAKVNDEVGTITSEGYRASKFKGQNYKIHRLIYWLETGTLPELIDHKVGDLDERGEKDNRFSNLRPATESQNMANKPHNKNNKLNLKGVSPHGKGFRAVIYKDKKTYRLGTFPTPEEAHAAYCKAASELYGDFARSTNTAFGSISVGLENLTPAARAKLGV